MGLAASAFFFAARRISEEAAGWPVTPGKVVISSTETFYEWSDGQEQIFHAPVVEFTYQVHGHEYRSRQITLGSKLAGTQSLAARIAARYPQGSAVKVHYDPANASNAVLQVASSLNWLPLALALFCFGVAAYASGVLGH
jgi:hypothetical protein